MWVALLVCNGASQANSPFTAILERQTSLIIPFEHTIQCLAGPNLVFELTSFSVTMVDFWPAFLLICCYRSGTAKLCADCLLPLLPSLLQQSSKGLLGAAEHAESHAIHRGMGARDVPAATVGVFSHQEWPCNQEEKAGCRIGNCGHFVAQHISQSMCSHGHFCLPQVQPCKPEAPSACLDGFTLPPPGTASQKLT